MAQVRNIGNQAIHTSLLVMGNAPSDPSYAGECPSPPCSYAGECPSPPCSYGPHPRICQLPTLSNLTQGPVWIPMRMTTGVKSCGMNTVLELDSMSRAKANTLAALVLGSCSP